MLVHEITWTAYKQLRKREQSVPSWGEHYAIVGMRARYGGSGCVLYVVDWFDNSYWACRRCNQMNEISLFNGMVSSDYPAEYEVWHIVDDNEDGDVVTYSLYLFNEKHENIGEIDIDCESDGWELAEKLINISVVKFCEIASFDGQNNTKLAYVNDKTISIRKSRSLARKSLSQGKPCHDEDGRKPYHLLLSFPEKKAHDQCIDVSGETQLLKDMQEDGYDWDGFYDWCKSPACKKLIDACTLALSDLGVLD